MELNKQAKIYLGLIFIIAILLYGFLVFNYSIDNYKELLFWGILAIAVESILIPLPNDTVGVSVGFAIYLATTIVGGPLMATTVALLGMLFRFPKIQDRGYIHIFNLPLYKTIFNVAQSIIITGTVGVLYGVVGGAVGKFSFSSTLLILPVDVVLNTFIISGFLSMATGQRFFGIWIENLKGVLPSAVAVGSMGIIIALAFMSYGWGAVLLFFGPLLLARYSFKLYIDMRNIYLSTIHALNKTIEAKDPYTSGHASRVEEYAVLLAEAMNMPSQKVQDVRTAAILHDIGKIGIDDNILNKTSKLTQIEYEQIMKHPTIGADIIKDVYFLKNISVIIKHHHERFDGKGYPSGLKGKDIPFEACILAIADAFDAMTSDRPYRNALSREEAIEEVLVNAGKQFHPVLAKKFAEIMSTR